MAVPDAAADTIGSSPFSGGGRVGVFFLSFVGRARSVRAARAIRAKRRFEEFLLRSGSIPDIAPLPVMHIH